VRTAQFAPPLHLYLYMNEMNDTTTQICIRCDAEKNADEFSVHPGTGRLRGQCKPCRAEAERIRRSTPEYKAGAAGRRIRATAMRAAKADRERQPGVYVWTDAIGRPVYVGVTDLLQRRNQEHNSRSMWAAFAVQPTKLHRTYDTIEQARKAEARLIRKYAKQGFLLLNRQSNPSHDGPEYYLKALAQLHYTHQVSRGVRI
jgi:predicted GIY-YIG superfamily endonuclease